MKEIQNDVYPVFDWILKRKHKEELLKQHSLAIWMTGLSGAGKTTVGVGVERELNRKGFLTQILDGDNVRTGINNNLGFSSEDRKENIRRIAEVTKLFVNCGIITINCFISPTKEIREKAKGIIGRDDFIEVFLDTPLDVCEERDTKGLYAKARKGEIKNFTGISAPFDPPEKPNIVVKTDEQTIEESVNAVLDYILPKIEFKG